MSADAQPDQGDARSAALIAAVQDSRPVALAILDSSLNIIEVNHEMAELAGTPIEAMVGRSARDVLAPVWEVLDLAVDAVLRTAEPFGPLKLSWVHEAGAGARAWEARLRPIVEADGETTGVVLAAFDESGERLLRDQLLQAQRMGSLGRLTGGIAHDFNNLLTAIGGYAELVHDSLPADDARRDDLDEVRKAVERARVLTLRLLAFTRGVPSEPQITPVDDIVRDLERLLRGLVGDDVQLHCLPQARGMVFLRPGELEQLLVNLVLNARDAMPGGGSVTVETEDVDLARPIPDGRVGVAPGEYVRIMVADTGTGMAADVQKRILEPCFTTKPPWEGSGLGLATVLGTLEQAGGDLTIHSRLGSGSRFDIFLPRVYGDEAASAAKRPAPSHGTEAVLVVEDQSEVLTAVVRMLGSLGYSVTGDPSPVEALDLCAHPETRPDLLITDVVMPLMSGPELARRCRTVAPQIRVLYMSGFSAGVALTPMLIKPFDQRALGLKVREVLDA
ncbi:MAG: ATP-binding protein [Solirubrobacteraceae bacterium]